LRQILQHWVAVAVAYTLLRAIQALVAGQGVAAGQLVVPQLAEQVHLAKVLLAELVLRVHPIKEFAEAAVEQVLLVLVVAYLFHKAVMVAQVFWGLMDTITLAGVGVEIGSQILTLVMVVSVAEVEVEYKTEPV
jgi:hypothetical protein